MTVSPVADDMPQVHDFAAQLMRQLLSDLDGILLDGEHAVLHALPFLTAAAAQGRPRGAVLLLLARAAAEAYPALLPEEDAAPSGVVAGEVLAQLAGVAPAQLPALSQAAHSIERVVAIAEPESPQPQQTLVSAILRLYQGLRDEDETLAGHGLVELRSRLVHLDATAQLIEGGRGDAPPLRTIRPDRFHDYFMRFTSLAQSQDSAGAEQAVAALGRDGRITALITTDAPHPVLAAAQQVHQAVAGDEVTKDHVLARIRALLEFLAALRRTPQPLLGDPALEPGVQLSLTVAAATAPLQQDTGFEPGVLGQIARYNQRLLNVDRRNPASTH
ncbi:MAG: hypothetical protein P4L83_19170 [Nevskia sp.]|nr:hypothetical protein [Nevskia sp.]